MISQISQNLIGIASLRLDILIKLRWIAIAGQLAAILLVYFGLEFALHFVWCMIFIALSVWLNIFLAVRFKANYRLGSGFATFLLTYDILQLAALLYLTGGLQNPFAIFLLAPTTIAAGHLRLHQVFALSAITLICATVLAFYYQPLPWFEGARVQLPHIYIMGVWSAIFVAMAFFGFFAWRIADERRQMNEALSASELVLAREQQLTALDGMAAAMAHELGTPLSTINIAAKEMFEEREKYHGLAEDIELIYTQSLKCREVLSQIGREGRDDLILSKMTFSRLFSELLEMHKKPHIEVKTVIKSSDGKPDHKNKMFDRNPAIIHGIGNILSNAMRCAVKNVSINLRISEDEVRMIIEDDGPGFDLEIIEHLGDPLMPHFHKKESKKVTSIDQSAEGLGLGLFIAKTFLERSGAGISFSNLPLPARGAKVEITWKKTIFFNMQNNNH